MERLHGELHPLTRAGDGDGTGTGTLFLPGSGVGVGDGNGDDGDGDFEPVPGTRFGPGTAGGRLGFPPCPSAPSTDGTRGGCLGRGVRGTTDILDPSVDQEIVVGAHAGGF